MIKINRNDAECLNHYIAVKQSILDRIPGILKSGIRYKKKHYTAKSPLKEYLQSLQLEVNLKPLITCAPENLNGIVNSLKSHRLDYFQKGSENNRILRNLFVTHGYEQMHKRDFIKRVNIDTCPYCNRNLITFLSDDGKIKPPIDHFYPASKFPMLALSYYNLIPSCQTCNGFDCKGDINPDDEDIQNPYLLTNKEFKFTFKPLQINMVSPFVDKTSIKIYFSQKVAGHLKVFKLEKLYEQHADIVLEMVVKGKVEYAKEYRKYLRDFTDIRLTEGEIDRMILGNYSTEAELHKRPFAKLSQDIGRELKLIGNEDH